jgi:hypothetical protein
MVKPWTCDACGKEFAGLTYFDKHRTGSYEDEHPHYARRCLSHDELLEIGLAQNAKGLYYDPAASAKMQGAFASQS